MVVYLLRNKEITVQATPAFDEENRGGVADDKDDEGHNVQNGVAPSRHIGPSGLNTLLLDHGNWMWIPPNVSFNKTVLSKIKDDPNVELVKIKGVMGMIYRNRDGTSDIAGERTIHTVPENLNFAQNEDMKRSPRCTLPNLDQESCVGPNSEHKEISALMNALSIKQEPKHEIIDLIDDDQNESKNIGQPACVSSVIPPKYLFPREESSHRRKLSEPKCLGSTSKKEIERSSDEYRRNPHYSHKAELPHRSSRSKKSSEIVARVKRSHSTHERDREPLHTRYRSRSPPSRRARSPHCSCNRQCRDNFSEERRLTSRRDKDIPSRKDFPHAQNLNQKPVKRLDSRLDRDERRVQPVQPNPSGTGSARTKGRRKRRENARDLARILAAGEAWARANLIGSDEGMQPNAAAAECLDDIIFI